MNTQALGTRGVLSIETVSFSVYTGLGLHSIKEKRPWPNPIPDKLLEELVAGKTRDEIFGKDGPGAPRARKR